MTLFPSLLRNQNLCILLAKYPECLLSRASSRKAGGRHPRPRSPPAPVELGQVGTEGGVFSASCAWGLEGWGVGVGRSGVCVCVLLCLCLCSYLLFRSVDFGRHLAPPLLCNFMRSGLTSCSIT